MARMHEGTSLVETIVAMTIAGLVVVSALPTMARLIDDGTWTRDDDVPVLAMTLERLINELDDARRILAPRAIRGARRAPLLVFLDPSNRLTAVFCYDGALVRRSHDPTDGTWNHRSLGPCTAALFHDRGHTRRCVRIRLRLGHSFLATTIRLRNAVVPPAELKEPAEWPTLGQPSLHDRLRSLEHAYFTGTPRTEHRLEAAFSTNGGS